MKKNLTYKNYWFYFELDGRNDQQEEQSNLDFTYGVLGYNNQTNFFIDIVYISNLMKFNKRFYYF